MLGETTSRNAPEPCYITRDEVYKRIVWYHSYSFSCMLLLNLRDCSNLRVTLSRTQQMPRINAMPPARVSGLQ